jgi:hypothetical protein
MGEIGWKTIAISEKLTSLNDCSGSWLLTVDCRLSASSRHCNSGSSMSDSCRTTTTIPEGVT